MCNSKTIVSLSYRNKPFKIRIMTNLIIISFFLSVSFSLILTNSIFYVLKNYRKWMKI